MPQVSSAKWACLIDKSMEVILHMDRWQAMAASVLVKLTPIVHMKTLGLSRHLPQCSPAEDRIHPSLD